jgi:hypothetical protein
MGNLVVELDGKSPHAVQGTMGDFQIWVYGSAEETTVRGAYDPDEYRPVNSPYLITLLIVGAEPDECSATFSPSIVAPRIVGAEPDECRATFSPSNIDAEGAVVGCVNGVIICFSASILTS